MSGEGVSRISGIGNGWKVSYSTSTSNMLREDFRCVKTRHFLGTRRCTSPVTCRRGTLEGTGKCAVALTTNSKDVGAPTKSELKQAGDPLLHIVQAMATRMARGNPGESKRTKNCHAGQLTKFRVETWAVQSIHQPSAPERSDRGQRTKIQRQDSPT